MNSDQLAHLVYCSAATGNCEPDALKDILATSRKNNSSLGITGILLYTQGSFFQVLEGDESVITELFARICADNRHTRITRIILEPIAERVFSAWTMGFAELTAGDLVTLDGANDFFHRDAPLAELAPGRARKLLHAFAEGRWRNKLDGQTA